MQAYRVSVKAAEAMVNMHRMQGFNSVESHSTQPQMGYVCTMLSATDLTKSYGALPILKGVSMEVAAGEMVGIVGASGAGKSTLLHILGTLDRADSGTLNIDGTDVLALNRRKMAHFRNRRIGFVFQFHHLLPEFSALENVAMPAWIAGATRHEGLKIAEEWIDRMGLRERGKHKPSELSGGEQQRVAIARALVNRPAIVLADEPTGNLDSENSRIVFSLLSGLRRELGQTFILVTHNDELAASCDRVLRMADGKMLP